MNTGKPSEGIFEGFFLPYGKEAFLFRLPDMAEVRGRSRGATQINMRKQPSDYLVTCKGETFYAEVKSTESATSFRKSQIEDEQWRSAVKVTASGGSYLFFIHALAMNEWFCVPAKFIIESGQKSWKWNELEQFKFQSHHGGH